MQSPAARRAFIALLSGAVMIGFGPILVRLIDVGYTAAGFWRVALALPVLWLLWYPRRWRPGRAAPPNLRMLAFGGAFFAADLVLWHQSIRLTSVANATLLANLCPIFVTAVSVWLFGERINARFTAGLALATAGSVVLVLNSLDVSRETVIGDLFGIGAAIVYSGYLLIVSRERRHSTAIEVMWWSTLASAALLLPLVLALDEPLWPQSARGWAVLVGLALVAQVVGQGLIASGMAHLSAAFSSVSLLVQPVAAALFAWLLLDESFGALQALGGAIVLGGIVLCRLATIRS
jgi:drug/metabolite transporter (DMT)-like permease